MSVFYSHGKLLLTGEYVVLDGALALAIPTKKGQLLSIEPISDPLIIWNSIDENQETWYSGEFHLHEILTMPLSAIEPLDITRRLHQVLVAAKTLNREFLSNGHGFRVTSTLEFARDWGLGSSSTLIANIANWAQVNPYELLELTFGGSGYDIACARNDTPLLYQLKASVNGMNTEITGRSIHKNPIVKNTTFKPEFSNALCFVHLNKKQDSRDGIARYKLKQDKDPTSINAISAITREIVSCESLVEFNKLINEHEYIISKILDAPTVKNQRFNDFDGSIKSLGAWGGDFVLATSEKNPSSYFKDKGYDTVIPFNDMILK